MHSIWVFLLSVLDIFIKKVNLNSNFLIFGKKLSIY